MMYSFMLVAAGSQVLFFYMDYNVKKKSHHLLEMNHFP